jgi:ABC-type nitrate/sulfonate/bicarbonate transport system substrate-binding protein
MISGTVRTSYDLTRRAALALTAAALARPALVRAQTPSQLHIAGVPEDSITPAVWALQKQIFRRHGLDVQLETQHSGSAVAAGVAGGAYQIGKSSMISLLVAHAHNVPVVVVAPGGLYDPSDANEALIVKIDSPIRSGADLNGKIIAVSALNDLYTIGARCWIDAHGGDSSTVKFVELPIAAVQAAVEAGRIDAGATIDPDLQEAVNGGKVRILCDPNSAIAPRFMYTGWMATTDYARDNRATIDKFRAAMQESGRYVNAHPAETTDVMAAFTSIAPAVFAKMPRVKASLTVDQKLIQPLIDACAKYKAIPASFDARDLIDAALR